MHVVEGGIGPVDGVGSDALPVATVIGVVAAAVVEVDAAEEGPIVPRTVAITDDHHLLVMAAEREHPLVQQDLTARPDVEVLAGRIWATTKSCFCRQASRLPSARR